MTFHDVSNGTAIDDCPHGLVSGTLRKNHVRAEKAVDFLEKMLDRFRLAPAVAFACVDVINVGSAILLQGTDDRIRLFPRHDTVDLALKHG